MSYTKARESQAREPVDTGTSLMCRVPGCGRRWTCDVQHGKACSLHDEQFSKAGMQRPPARSIAASLPTLGEVVKPYTEVDDDRPF